MPPLRAPGEWRRHPGIRSGLGLAPQLDPGDDVARQAVPTGDYPRGMLIATPPITPV